MILKTERGLQRKLTKKRRRADVQLLWLLTPVILSPFLLWVVFSIRRRQPAAISTITHGQKGSPPSIEETLGKKEAERVLSRRDSFTMCPVDYSVGYFEDDWKCYVSGNDAISDLGFCESVCHWKDSPAHLPRSVGDELVDPVISSTEEKPETSPREYTTKIFLAAIVVAAAIWWYNHTLAESIRNSQLKSLLFRIRRALETREPLSRIRNLVHINGSVLACTNEDLQTILHMACAYHVTCVEIIRYLVQEFPAATEKTDKWKKTPLLEACLHEPPLAVVQLLVEQSPRSVEMVDVLGRTPLHQECFHRPSLAVVHYLAMQGPICCLAADNKDGRLPLDYAQRSDESVVPFVKSVTLQAIYTLSSKKGNALPLDVCEHVLAFLRQGVSSNPYEMMHTSYERSTTAESLSTVSTSDQYYRLRVQVFRLVLKVLNIE